ncbi:22030_t:CDS:2 [Dentiscutata erythropus]|uniref:22030_t:CDS:1 n=1 Tax=Dentiscutata erythropus TaxID=1348616 RepID=A0A9N9FYD2_9GLOM|nr:22030_t:CDS:2 [Dentiscutata erythropus]
MSFESKYPKNNPFSLKQNHTIYTYHIINEGYYPSKDIICYTSTHTRSHIVECEIEYQSNRPVFRIKFKENSQQYIVESDKSPSKVANKYLNVRKSSNTCSRISGVHIFGLNIIDVKHERKCKIFESEALNFYNPIDQPILQEVRFNVQSKNYSATYCNEKEQNIDADLTALEAGLPREHNVANVKQKINEKMGENILIFVIDIKNSFLTTNETSYITDKDIEEEMLQYVGKAGYRPITNILLFKILDLLYFGPQVCIMKNYCFTESTKGAYQELREFRLLDDLTHTLSTFSELVWKVS